MLAIIEDNVALFAVKKPLKIAVLAPTYAYAHLHNANLAAKVLQIFRTTKYFA